MAQCWIPEYWNPLHTTNITHTTQTLAYNPPHEGLPIPPDDEYSLRTDGRTRPISTLLRHGTKDFHHHWTPHTLARYIPTCQAILLHPPLTHHGDISALSTPQVYYSCWLLYRQNTISSHGDTLPHTVVGACAEFQRTGRFLTRRNLITMRCSTLRGTFCSLITLATPRQDWTGSNPSRREGGGWGFILSRSHSCYAVRLVYTQISPGHIWTTLYF